MLTEQSERTGTDRRFDFDTLPTRDGFGSAKWARRTGEEKTAGVVPMTIADMDFACAPCVVAAVEEAARHGVYGYTDPDARYLAAVTGWMWSRHGYRALPEWIVTITGVVPALCMAVRAFTEPGDGVLIQSPGYGPFREAVLSNGRVPMENRLRQDADGRYSMDFDDLEQKAQDPRVKLLLLCSPHNPVGRVWTEDELQTVGDICARHGVVVVSDEIHCDLVLSGKHRMFADAAAKMQNRCLMLTAPSKTFNLAGLQLANVIVPDEGLRKRYADTLYAAGICNVSYFGYHATIAAYRDGAPWLEALLAYVRGNFDTLERFFSDCMPRVRMTRPEATYLAWTDWRAYDLDEDALISRTRGDALVPMVPGAAFGAGGEGFLRMNLALPRAELQRALDRLNQLNMR